MNAEDSAVPSGRVFIWITDQPRCRWLISGCPRRDKPTPRPAFRVEGEATNACARAGDVIGKERNRVRSTSRSVWDTVKVWRILVS